MPESKTVYIGIDPTAGRRPVNYAVLDSRLRTIALGAGDLQTVMAAIGGYESAVCAVDAPQSPNGGLLTQPEVRLRYGLRPDATTWSQFKVCEYRLRRHGIGIYSTPSDANAAKPWMRLGWELYDRLRAAGYSALLPGEPGAAKAYIEVHPHACFTVLLGHVPYKKNTLEGRLQRQLILADQGLDVPDALEVLEEITRHRLLEGMLEFRSLLTHDQLDALVGAYTACLAATQPKRASWVGEEIEGQIVVPVETLKEKYAR